VTKTEMGQLRGLRALIEQAVDQGTSAVERVHRATAARPFAVLEAIPPVAFPARGVRVVHDAILDTVYGSIRQVNRVVGGSLALALDAMEGAAKSSDAPALHEGHVGEWASRPDDRGPERP
jgi:hypothetical protein